MTTRDPETDACIARVRAAYEGTPQEKAATQTRARARRRRMGVLMGMTLLAVMGAVVVIVRLSEIVASWLGWGSMGAANLGAFLGLVCMFVCGALMHWKDAGWFDKESR